MRLLYLVQELSARCYAECPGCFRGFVDGPRDGDMDERTFENTIKNLDAGTMILPQFHGEALLHPAFADCLRRYKEKGLRVSIPTSGFAGERHIPDLVGEQTPVYVLIVSIDGFSSHSHETRRGKIALARASSFLDRCLLARGERKTPWLAARWVENGQSEVEFELYLKHWLFERKVDMVLRSRMFEYGTENNSPVNLGKTKCHSLIEGNPVVLFNGDVLLCERVPSRTKYVLGNVNEDPLDVIMERRFAMCEGYPDNDPCQLCSAAYLLTGFQGEVFLRHPETEEETRPIYYHVDHSQSFYSLTKTWSGINWGLK